MFVAAPHIIQVRPSLTREANDYGHLKERHGGCQKGEAMLEWWGPIVEKNAALIHNWRHLILSQPRGTWGRIRNQTPAKHLAEGMTARARIKMTAAPASLLTWVILEPAWKCSSSVIYFHVETSSKTIYHQLTCSLNTEKHWTLLCTASPIENVGYFRIKWTP